MAAPDAIATDYTINSKFYGSVNAASELVHLRFGPAVAYQITPELSLGARFDVDYGSLDLRMPMGLAYMDIGQCDGFGVSGAVGLFYKPRKNLSFGLYYESPTAMQNLTSRNGDGYLKMMTPGGEVSFNNLNITVDDLQFSQNFGVGAAYSPLPALRLSADVKYLDWNSNWDELTLKFGGGGADDMKAAGLPTTLKIPLNIANQWTFSLGAEYFFGEIYKVSLGYHYGDDAMSNNYLLPYIPAEFEHTLTCGFSMMPAKTVKISLAYMYSIIDDATSSGHAYDASLEKQLGMPPGSLQSEYNNAETDYNCQSIQISLSFYW
jgi:long-subunit fatty acid transport protein